jgi:deoxyribodipyrimidine photo-lyase
MDPNGLAVRIFLERQRFRKIELPASSAPIIVWFREDFRLSDNPAVHAAAKQGRPIICLYIHMDGRNGERGFGGASRWWLDKSLKALSRDIEQLGGQLTVGRAMAAPAWTK